MPWFCILYTPRFLVGFFTQFYCTFLLPQGVSDTETDEEWMSVRKLILWRQENIWGIFKVQGGNMYTTYPLDLFHLYDFFSCIKLQVALVICEVSLPRTSTDSEIHA